MTISIEVGKIKITSDTATVNKDFIDLVDQLTGPRLKILIAADQQIEAVQQAVAQTATVAAAAPAATQIQTVTPV